MSKKLTPALLVAGLIACSPAVVAAAEQRSVDNLGMKLGKTPAEIKAALQASDLQFQTREIKHTLKDLPNAPFVGSVHAIRHGADVRSDEIRVDFPPPPHEPRAVLITRLVQYPINAGPLTRDVAAALEDKYGADRWIDDRYANAASLRLAWIDTPAGVQHPRQVDQVLQGALVASHHRGSCLFQLDPVRRRLRTHHRRQLQGRRSRHPGGAHGQRHVDHHRRLRLAAAADRADPGLCGTAGAGRGEGARHSQTLKLQPARPLAR